jgi:hypothetical protein
MLTILGEVFSKTKSRAGFGKTWNQFLRKNTFRIFASIGLFIKG